MTIRILTGDVRDVLPKIETESVQMCVTSPPYWGLRSYLPPDHPLKDREIGLEDSVDDWVHTMVDVFAEVHRVLKPDGTLWLNLGDSYAGTRDPNARHSATITGKKASASAQAAAHRHRTRGTTDSRRRDRVEIPRSDVRSPGFKNKDMHGQPWRAAFALQGFAVISCLTIGEWADLLQAARASQDWAMVELVEQRLRAWDFTQRMQHNGWVLRQEIIWHKQNPMPESMRDRCTTAHEHIFLFAKQRFYFFNHKAIAEPSSPDSHARYARNRSADHKHAGAAAVPGSTPQTIAQGFEHMRPHAPAGWETSSQKARQYRNNGVGFGHGYDRANGAAADGKSVRMGREPGWRARPKTHEGTKSNSRFDAAMVEQYELRNKRTVWTFPTEGFKGAHFATFPRALVEPCVLAGSRPGDVVLDIFGGSGTTGLVADIHGRDALLIDIDERNDSMARQRIAGGAPLTTEIIQETVDEDRDAGCGVA